MENKKEDNKKEQDPREIVSVTGPSGTISIWHCQLEEYESQGYSRTVVEPLTPPPPKTKGKK
jgi:hypothetical protein